ncbi:MAG: hypothetical protein IT310_06020 [Anaerolineales bacterium]|nr:hypothetical protein [Anaerolineales bacterium]
MEDPKAYSQKTVTEFLAIAPPASRAFFQLKMFCPKCPLARFCTLTDAMAIYEIEAEIFFEAVSKHLDQNSKQGE